MTTPAPLVDRGIFRGAIYRSLADVFHLPGPELPETLQILQTSMAYLGSGGCSPARRVIRSFENGDTLVVLQVDFTRLFAGPFLVLAPPYGSVYLEGGRRIMGDSTVEAQAHYRRAGLDLAGHFKEAPDHIAAELEFMHVLVLREAEALHCGHLKDALKSFRHQREFLQNHLGAWAPAFAARVAENAETSFYRQLAEATRRFVTEELERVSASNQAEPGMAGAGLKRRGRRRADATEGVHEKEMGRR